MIANLYQVLFDRDSFISDMLGVVNTTSTLFLWHRLIAAGLPSKSCILFKIQLHNQ